MPTYEYQCQACQHRFEEFQSITAEPLTLCPSCGKHEVVRLISSGAGFIFKGSGFYITDYRSDAYKNAAKSDSGSSSGTTSTAATTAAATPPSTPAAPAAPAAPSAGSAPAAGS